MIEESLNEQVEAPQKRLGKLPAKSSLKALHFSEVIKAEPAPPKSSNFWAHRKPFPAHSYGNRQHGCCTRASQVVATTRMERIEQRKTLEVTTDEVLRVYYAMTDRLYGGGDTGAFEPDALSEWRKPDLTFRDTRGHPYTIDAFMRVNQANVDEVKRAIAFSGAHGIKVCFALPEAWAEVEPPAVWDVAEDQALVGPWMPNSWGGHSLGCYAYNEKGVLLGHTWYDDDTEHYGMQWVTWQGFTTFCDEAYIIVDRVNEWKKRKLLTTAQAGAIVEAVNSVSEQKI